MANRVQMIGSEAALASGPHDMRQDAFGGGMVEMVGSEASLAHRTTSLGVFDKGVRGGRVEMTGTEVQLSHTPVRGWESYGTPISDNSQSSMKPVSGYPTSKRRQ